MAANMETSIVLFSLPQLMAANMETSIVLFSLPQLMAANMETSIVLFSLPQLMAANMETSIVLFSLPQLMAANMETSIVLFSLPQLMAANMETSIVFPYHNLWQPIWKPVLTQFFVHLILRIIENPLTRAFADGCQLHQLRRPGDVLTDEADSRWRKLL